MSTNIQDLPKDEIDDDYIDFGFGEMRLENGLYTCRPEDIRPGETRIENVLFTYRPEDIDDDFLGIKFEEIGIEENGEVTFPQDGNQGSIARDPLDHGVVEQFHQFSDEEGSRSSKGYEHEMCFTVPLVLRGWGAEYHRPRSPRLNTDCRSSVLIDVEFIESFSTEWDATMEGQEPEKTQFKKVTQVEITDLCPSTSKSNGKPCKAKSRKFVKYCSNHNICITCRKPSRSDWPKCEACDPEGINENGKQRPVPRKNKCKACKRDYKCVVCRLKLTDDENQEPQAPNGKMCPSVNKNNGQPCKRLSRSNVGFCTVHNRCIRCGKFTKEDWSYCMECDSEGVDQNGKSRVVPRANKCMACIPKKCDFCKYS